jgi:hypothetical protein
MPKVPLTVVEMTKDGSEMTEEELSVFAEEMYNTMLGRMKAYEAAASTDADEE